MMVSLDGYFEGLNHDLSWHKVDAEFNEFAIAQLKSVDSLLFGRRTYELMKNFWPTKQARKVDPIVAGLMNNTSKIVFSRKLRKVEETEFWKNVKLFNKIQPENIKKMKKKAGNNIAIFGSNNLTVSLIKMDLVDELRVMLNPVLIGRGTRLFDGLHRRLNLKLTKTKTFKNGNVLLYYQPIKQ